MSNYNIIVSTDESTLVTEYTSQKKRSGAYQSEASLEKEFIEILSSQGYQYAKDINSSEKMISNLRSQLEIMSGKIFIKIVSLIKMKELNKSREKYKRILFKF